jgi:hypothetical protein
LKLFFHKVSFIINALFPRLPETLQDGRVKIFAEASVLFKHVVSHRLPQNGVLGEHPSGRQRDAKSGL